MQGLQQWYQDMLSRCTEDLISTSKIIIFLPNSPVGNEKVPFISIPISYAVYIFTVFPWVNVILMLSCSNQSPSNSTLILLPI